MDITKGKIKHPMKAVLYGPEGIGKSTFASGCPGALFVDAEKGTGHLDIARTPQATSWAMLTAIVQELTKNSQGYKTLVIDTADWADKLAQHHVCAAGNKSSIEEFGYGKGWMMLAEAWKKMIDLLAELQEKQGMAVLFLAHAQMRKFEQPDEAGAYDRWELKLEKKTSALLKEWADVILFANFRTIVVDVEGKKKAQGGERVIYTQHHNCWDAKTRYDLPGIIKFEKKFPAELIALFSDNPIAPVAKEVAKQSAPVAKPEPVKEAAKEPETPKAPEKAKDDVPMPTLAPHLARLRDLMSKDKVTTLEIQQAVAKRGFYPVDTKISNYDASFVDGSLVAAWPKVVAMVEQIRKEAA